MSEMGNSPVIKNNIDPMILQSDILFEDNHLIAINKNSSQIVQADKSGDVSLDKLVNIYIKNRHDLKGRANVGIIHRIDRRASGVVLFALTDEALSGMSRLFRDGEVKKIYWAITAKIPVNESGRLDHFLKKNEKLNKSYAYLETAEGAKPSSLIYKVIARSEKYYLIEIELITGRHHQIRCQLASIGCPVKGDLKYGFPRSNKDGSISLHARSVSFIHPIEKEPVLITAPVPEDNLWRVLTERL